MICRILLLFILTSCVCGTFVVNVTQTSYQAEENSNITLEWTFTTKPDGTLTHINIFCELWIDNKPSCLYELRDDLEVPEFQDEQFAGRVQCDKDVLREGRFRLHVSRLRTEDSGLYVCYVRTNYGGNSGECRLSVTAAKDWPKPERPNTAGWDRSAIYWGLGLTAAVVLVVGGCIFILFLSNKQSRGRLEESCRSAAGS